MSKNRAFPSDRVWCMWRWMPSAILIVAAILKIINAPRLLAGDGLLSSAVLLNAAVFTELAVSILIILLPVGLSWLLTLATFGLLLTVATASQFLGLTCNCFGSKSYSWISIAVDVLVLAACLVARPKNLSLANPKTSVVLTGAALGALGVVAVSVVDARAPKSDPIEYLLAEELINRPWPINSAMHDKLVELETGNWMVFVVRRDCEHCRELLQDHFSNESKHRSGERTAMFLTGAREWSFVFDQISFKVASAGTVEWKGNEPFVASPAVFILSKGIVLAAADGEESEEFVASAFREAR